METKALLDWADFVATKFQSSRDGWVYSRERNGLEHIRYESDYTGYNHWSKRVKRAFDWKHLTGTDSFSKAFGKQDLKHRLGGARAWIKVSLRKESNLPDGQINGNIVHWEEDGEYMAIFQPRVGVKVLEFLQAEPDNPYAQAIVAEMKACVELSWPDDRSDEDGSDSDEDEED